MIIIGYAVALYLTGCARHYGFLTSMNDLGHYDQAIWTATQTGRLLNTSQFGFPINKLGFHFDPILYLFIPLYYLKPTTTWLIAAQALAIAISCWPIYLTARHFTASVPASRLWTVAYMVNPFLLNAATWDFHPTALAVPWVALAVLAVAKHRFYLLLAACAMIMLCKEHFGLMVAGFGLMWAMHYREKWRSVTLIGIGIVHLLLVVHYLMPYFSPTGTHVMMSTDLGQLSRYGWLGHSLGEIVSNLCTRPVAVLGTVAKIGGPYYLALLTLPFLGFPLLGGVFLLPAAGDLAANLLSANPMPRSPLAYHSAAILPLFCAAALKGSSFLLRRFVAFPPVALAAILLLPGLVFAYSHTALPLPGSRNFWAPAHATMLPDPRLTEIRRLIGDTSSVSAQANVGAHFSQRKNIYIFPAKVDVADFIVLRLAAPTNKISPPEIEKASTLASHLQLTPKQYLTTLEDLLKTEKYGVIYWDKPWIVFKVKHQPSEIPQDIYSALEKLKENWL